MTARNAKDDTDAPCELPCPIERSMRMIGGKWTASVLWHLKDGPVRFNELSRLLTGASKKILSQRLSEMEENGLITRHVISEKPIAVTYEISPFGQSVLGILEDLKSWAEAQEI